MARTNGDTVGRKSVRSEQLAVLRATAPAARFLPALVNEPPMYSTSSVGDAFSARTVFDAPDNGRAHGRSLPVLASNAAKFLRATSL